MPDLPSKEELEAMYGSGLSQEAIGALYGVSAEPIRRLFREYGLQARPDCFDSGQRWKCDDGHEVRSQYEQRIDNWLHAHSVPHTYEPKLPFHTQYRGDFLANDWYIEVWGIQGCPAYTARKQLKKTLYASYGLPLINVEAWHFDDRRYNLEARLRRCLTPIRAQGLLF